MQLYKHTKINIKLICKCGTHSVRHVYWCVKSYCPLSLVPSLPNVDIDFRVAIGNAQMAFSEINTVPW